MLKLKKFKKLELEINDFQESAIKLDNLICGGEDVVESNGSRWDPTYDGFLGNFVQTDTEVFQYGDSWSTC